MSLTKRLKNKRVEIAEREEKITNDLDMIINENFRVAEVAKNASVLLDNLDEQFEALTKLDKIDVKFLFFATALQCIRQYVLSNDKFRYKNDIDGSKAVKKLVPKTYHDILLGPVPYDAVNKSVNLSDLNTGISGANHRYTVLGHDPLLGWIFGTMNILTDSLTKKSLQSYRVVDYKISEVVLLNTLFEEGYEYYCYDYKLLAASVAKQGLHLGSDAFTTMGLPIPIINSAAPELTSSMMKHRLDSYGIGRAIVVATLINSIVAAIHGLFYDEEKHASRELYEVKTRKILKYSNLIAVTSNVIYVAVMSYFGDKEAVKKLDLGGIVVVIYRLISDRTFIMKVKEEFVCSGFNRMIQDKSFQPI